MHCDYTNDGAPRRLRLLGQAGTYTVCLQKDPQIPPDRHSQSSYRRSPSSFNVIIHSEVSGSLPSCSLMPCIMPTKSRLWVFRTLAAPAGAARRRSKCWLPAVSPSSMSGGRSLTSLSCRSRSQSVLRARSIRMTSSFMSSASLVIASRLLLAYRLRACCVHARACCVHARACCVHAACELPAACKQREASSAAGVSG